MRELSVQQEGPTYAPRPKYVQQAKHRPTNSLNTRQFLFVALDSASQALSQAPVRSFAARGKGEADEVIKSIDGVTVTI